MKLDRHINPDGKCKYLLINRRKLAALLERGFAAEGEKPASADILRALNVLREHGVLIDGTESPGRQFFAILYQDAFAHQALWAYAEAAQQGAHALMKAGEKEKAAEMLEYAYEIKNESEKAAAVKDHKLPD